MEATWALVVSAALQAAHAGIASGWPEQVELFEDGKAEVVSLRTAQTSVVPRRQLPAAAREGDVLVNGEVDAERTAAMVQRVQALQARAVRAPESLEDPKVRTGPR